MLCRPLLCVLVCDASLSCRYCIISPARCRLRRPSRWRRPTTLRLLRRPFCDISSPGCVLARRAVRCADCACRARPPQHLEAGVLGGSRLPLGRSRFPLICCPLAARPPPAFPTCCFVILCPPYPRALHFLFIFRSSPGTRHDTMFGVHPACGHPPLCCRRVFVRLNVQLEAAPRAGPSSPTRARCSHSPALPRSRRPALLSFCW